MYLRYINHSQYYSPCLIPILAASQFRVVNPELSGGEVIVNLHVDVEAQKTYRPGYSIEKRGIYYLARELSSQLSLLIPRPLIFPTSFQSSSFSEKLIYFFIVSKKFSLWVYITAKRSCKGI